MLSCRDLRCFDAIRFVAIHALLCKAQLTKKSYLLSKNDKYDVWSQRAPTLISLETWNSQLS